MISLVVGIYLLWMSAKHPDYWLCWPSAFVGAANFVLGVAAIARHGLVW